MANRKDEQLTYGQLPLPQGTNNYVRLKVDWSGLNRRQTTDTGVLSMERNISTAEAPYLTPSQVRTAIKEFDGSEIDNSTEYHVISMFGFDGFLVVVYRQENKKSIGGVMLKDELKIAYLTLNENGKVKDIHIGYVTTKDSNGNTTKKALDKLKTGETDEPRTMVQFNVYENAADVLDGVYVKRLLLFPDKVSMYMKIVKLPDKLYRKDGTLIRSYSGLYDADNEGVYSSASETSRKEVDVTNTDVMYYYDYDKRYFSWNGSKCINLTYELEDNAGKKYYFKTDSLDVIVKDFYNDGFEAATGIYDDGFRPSSHKWFNYDGYKPMDGKRFQDGFVQVATGKYEGKNLKKDYYERSGACSPYTYTKAMLEEGDSLAGLYEIDEDITSDATIGSIYTRSGDEYPYEYTVSAESFSTGDSLDGYYMYVGSRYYALTPNKLYKRIVTEVPVTEEISEGSVYSDLKVKQSYKKIEISYEEITEYTEENGTTRPFRYKDNISGYYEKSGSTEIKSYYKRGSMVDGIYTYTPIEESELEYGKDVSKYFVRTDKYTPPEGSGKNCYWKNTATQMCYRYDDERADWVIAFPPSFPNLKYAAVHVSRLFGVDKDRVHVSGFNDYSNWNLDTVNEMNESNAWSSAAQANTRANGEFTGITVYDNHVVCFKRDYMHEIYNTKNPFRLVDVYAEGTIDNRSVQEVNGRLIFVSEDEVKIYTGSNPRIIGYYLGIDKFTEAVSGTDGRNYYLYCEGIEKDGESGKHLFVYDTYIEQWSEQDIGADEVLSFAKNKNGMYMLTRSGIIYKLDTGKYDQSWSFETDMTTSLTSSSSSNYPTVNIKHLAKLQMLAYAANGARFKVYALYDNEVFDKNENWNNKNKAHLIYDSNGRSGLFPVRIKTRMTANYGLKLHFEGYGYVRLHEMELLTAAGGELWRDK